MLTCACQRAGACVSLVLRLGHVRCSEADVLVGVGMRRLVQQRCTCSSTVAAESAGDACVNCAVGHSAWQAASVAQYRLCGAVLALWMATPTACPEEGLLVALMYAFPRMGPAADTAETTLHASRLPASSARLDADRAICLICAVDPQCIFFSHAQIFAALRHTSDGYIYRRIQGCRHINQMARMKRAVVQNLGRQTVCRVSRTCL